MASMLIPNSGATNFANWISYTPTFTNLTVGNGTTEARYRRLGNTIDIVFKFTLGSTSSISSFPTITLPVNAKYTGAMIGNNSYIDSGTTYYVGRSLVASASTVWFGADNASATYSTVATLSSTVPFTWGSTDVIFVTMSYEAA
jgi:hypothetical protein